ncbi:MAG: quinone-dependent dihydroorotate dehydrogenase [Alphaproteobacteria bacterium]
MDRFRLARAFLSRVDPETAHDLTLWALRCGLGPAGVAPDDPVLAVRLWGRDFANPLGLAAGFDKNATVIAATLRWGFFDKNATVIAATLRWGFGFVEVGSITPAAQPGNAKPRVFRLAEDEAVINRLGFPSQGLAAAAARIGRWRAQSERMPAERTPAEGRPAGLSAGLVGVNLGKNRDSADPAADYAEGARMLAPYADYLAVNVSSPNTPGLRALQGRDQLARIVGQVRAALAGSPPTTRPPLLVKIAPDLSAAEMAEIAAVAVELKLAGLIVGNTTVARPETLAGADRGEAGGLSGRPLFAPSTDVLGEIYRLTEGRVPLVGVGGVGSAADAYAKIRAGASLVQLYTALIYRGPGLVAEIKAGLAALLRRDGFSQVSEAVGADHR